uniref:Secreted protein n=1 Tax=Nelumbo nucifera TaxID=4432 RepID=A0A822XW69_NELNU|nr:TPA_asm: hypothetical protein HUJ06_024488 [Nelumbo nucifera]
MPCRCRAQIAWSWCMIVMVNLWKAGDLQWGWWINCKKGKWVKAAAVCHSAPGLGVDCGSTPFDIKYAFSQALLFSLQVV